AHQPGPGDLTVELRQGPPGLHHRLLDDVVGERRVTHDRACEAVHGVAVRGDELREGALGRPSTPRTSVEMAAPGVRFDQRTLGCRGCRRRERHLTERSQGVEAVPLMTNDAPLRIALLAYRGKPHV